MKTQDHWADLARRLSRMGPPQQPGPDVAQIMAEICAGRPGLTVLLGVTPALADLGRPLRAFDSSAGAIANLWPGDTADRRAELGDWSDLPLPDGAAASVLGDGTLNSLPDRHSLRNVLAEIRRVLAPQGCAAIRVFARPTPAVTIADVLAEARNGHILSLNQLRWKIAGALATGPDHAVAVTEILRVAEQLDDLTVFARQHGLDQAQAEHFYAYRSATARYLFPDRAALAGDAAQAGLSCRWVETAGYPGAEDCPIAVLTPV